MGYPPPSLPEGRAQQVAPSCGPRLGDLAAPAAINTVAIPVSVSGGLGAVAMGGLTRPWSEYVARVRNLRTLIDTLAQDHRQLADALSHAGGSH